MNARLLLLLPMLLCLLPMRGQTDPVLTQYFQAPPYYNPSAVGSTDLLRVSVGSRMQWIGIKGAPNDFIATADLPFQLLERRFGVGVKTFQESIGLYKTFEMGLQLSGRQKLGKGVLSMGVTAAYLTQTFRGSEVFIPDDDDYHEGTDDAIPTVDVAGDHFDLDLGVTYTHRLFTLGVACTHVLQPTINMTRGGLDGGGGGTGGPDEQTFEFTFPRTLYLTAESTIPLKDKAYELLPSLLVKSDLRGIQANLTARLRWNKFLTAGLGYRTQDAVSLLLQADYKGISLGYSYDYATSAIMRASSGSHEVWVGYGLKLNFDGKNRHRHKSIRFM